MQLGIETSTSQYATIALQLDAEHISQCIIDLSSDKHTKILYYIEDLFSKNNITLDNINTILFCHGPGSFTGVRIAASVAQGLSLAKQIPVAGVSSLQLLATEAVASLQNTDLILSILDARMSEIYYACFSPDGVRLSPDNLSQPDIMQLPLHNIQKLNIIGDVDNYIDIIKSSIFKINSNIKITYLKSYPKAQYMFNNSHDIVLGAPGQAYPIYLRPGVIIK